MRPSRFLSFALCALLASTAAAQTASIPLTLHARILQLEDERNLGGEELLNLLKDRRPMVRERVALALGRIGDRRATRGLIELLAQEPVEPVRSMAAFALGENDDTQAIPALLNALDQKDQKLAVNIRIVEALGKLGSLQPVEEAIRAQISEQLIRRLPGFAEARETDRKLGVRLAITSLMRLRSPASVVILSHQLQSPHAEIRADAANALFRLRRPLAEAVSSLLAVTGDPDPDVRGNAARALGTSGDTRAFDPLVKLLNDADARVRVSAVRGLQVLADRRAIEPLISTGEKSLAALQGDPTSINLLLEISTALGNFRAPTSLPFLQRLRSTVGVGAHPEVEITVARLGVFTPLEELKDKEWRREANLAAGYGEVTNDRANAALHEMLRRAEPRAVPAVLRAMAQRRISGLNDILKQQLISSNEFARAAAAALLTEPRDEATLNVLIDALKRSKGDQQNDAQLAIIQALARFKTPLSIEAVRNELSDRDQLVRRAAIDALRAMGEKTDQITVGPVQTGHNRAFYERIARSLNRRMSAVIETERGAITLELFNADAPLTVENFASLARRGFFNGIAFHRVVANFVVQGGDPRGDGEGGPGHQIRCEINLRPYSRGALGMALSGKDTGGSQFFITHSPQPHLDGGYTVFGRVTRGLEVVDRITRGDLIRRVTIGAR
jgi:cyclophilin family peptidyl-prolyl cis-trans isomerase